MLENFYSQYIPFLFQQVPKYQILFLIYLSWKWKEPFIYMYICIYLYIVVVVIVIVNLTFFYCISCFYL